MRVRCKLNDFNQIENSEVVERIEKQSKNTNFFDLQIGRRYTVYGIVLFDNYPWYFISLKEKSAPIYAPKDLFETSDGRISRYWKLSALNLNEIGFENCEPSTQLVFKEWSMDPFFFEKLAEGDEETLEIFLRYKALMDSEYSL